MSSVSSEERPQHSLRAWQLQVSEEETELCARAAAECGLDIDHWARQALTGAARAILRSAARLGRVSADPAK